MKVLLIVLVILSACTGKAECDYFDKKIINAVQGCLDDPRCSTTADEHYRYRVAKSNCNDT